VQETCLAGSDKKSLVCAQRSQDWNDLLIALSARELGAVLVTCNARDFELLRRYIRFELTVVN
jgi:predicted nucleic acid-binding protein